MYRKLALCHKVLLIIIAVSANERDLKQCVKFKPPDPDSRSIMYSVTKGRLGNVLLLYAFMLQLSISLKVDVYMTKDNLEFLSKFFTRESLLLPALEDTFCNHESIPWTRYTKGFRPLLVDKSYRTGQFMNLFPHDQKRTDIGGQFRYVKKVNYFLCLKKKSHTSL